MGLIGLAAFYALCAAGWQLFKLLKIPTPAILGPMVVLCVANLCSFSPEVPPWLRPLLSLIMGTIVGLRFHLKMKGLWRQMLLAVVWMLGLAMLTAKVLTVTGLPAPSALFAAMPGGISEISLVALTFGADIFVVALLQSSRLLLTMAAVPVIARSLKKSAPPAVPAPKSGKAPRPLDWAVLTVLAFGAAALFLKLKAPAGALLGPLIAVGSYTKISGVKALPGKRTQQLVQIGVGGLVGLGIQKESVMRFGEYILPIFCLCALIVGGSLLLAFVMHKTSGWDMMTCLLAASPAGLSPTVLLAIEMDADSGKVTVFQVLRMTTVLIFAPLCASFWFGSYTP